jgi:ribosomal protein L11 methyltransferase
VGELGGVRASVSGREVGGDWAERWRRFHQPLLVGGRLYVRPPWEPPLERRGVEDVVIDPGQAFGTGAHPTTAMCLELLLGLERRGSLADLGCGSGVLAIAAVKLGHAPVVALDADAAALEATLRNARENGVALGRVEQCDLREASPPGADVVVANLTRPLLVRVAELMAEPAPTLIASGVLDDEADQVARAFAPLRERRRLRRGGWVGLELRLTVDG